MSSRWTHVLILSLGILMVTLGAVNSAAAGPEISGVAPGKKLVVELHEGLGKKVKGSFVSSDRDGITLTLKDGEQTTVPWESVRKVKPKRSWTGLWVGMASGAAIAGAAMVGSDAASDAAWKAAWIGMSAGTMGAFGATVDVKRQPPIYQAPKTESASPK